MPGRIRIEMLDIALQDLSEDVVVVTAFFHIHLPSGGDYFRPEWVRPRWSFAARATTG